MEENKQTKNNDGPHLTGQSRPPLVAPGIAQGDICTPHDEINIPE